jgi:hypothetical protein
VKASAEIRWFWAALPPAGLEAWFRNADAHGCAAGGGVQRTDRYLKDGTQHELGVKLRGGGKGVEVKGLVVEEFGRIALGPFAGPLQLWGKWSSTALSVPSDATVATDKRRWQRAFDTGRGAKEIPLARGARPFGAHEFPQRGCNVELTSVTLPGGSVWWTLGFEAFGPLDSLERSVRATAKLLAARRPPPLAHGTRASYPAWLRTRVIGAERS